MAFLKKGWAVRFLNLTTPFPVRSPCLPRVDEDISPQLLLQNQDCLAPYGQAPHHDG